SDGQSVTAYQSASVSCGSSCNSQTRTCNDGSLSGSYAYSSCSVGSCNCTTSAGVSISNGQCKTLWNTSFGWNGSCGSPQCLSGNVCCNNGSLNTTVYAHSSCHAEPCCGN